MRATRDYVIRKFNDFNLQYFDGRLKPIAIRMSTARTFLGQVAYHRDRMADGTWHYRDFTFKISTILDLPEHEVEDIILHEMIHYYILSNQMQDTAPHGELFRGMMRHINTHFGRNISVTHRSTKAEKETDVQLRQHLICAVLFNTGERGITISTRTRIFRLWDAIPRVPGVVECKWYSSTDPFFNRYPRAIKVKIYRIAAEDLEKHLQGAVPLIRNGHTISVGNGR
jgi:predicted SprT family Zn-dependent metalloprotease